VWLKIITKLLGDMLQSVIISLVHQNQYGFIKTRTIQDCIDCAFEYIHQCKQSRQETAILKLDFTKAFDTIEHSAILEMMKTFDFNNDWLQWTTNILNLATTAVLLNGVLGKSLAYKRGSDRGGGGNVPIFVCASS
jgi:hypothetical protein